MSENGQKSTFAKHSKAGQNTQHQVNNIPFSFPVETSPKPKRKCGSKNVLENECKDVLYGPNSMLACFCDEHDYCNSATYNDFNFSIIFAAIIFYFVTRCAAFYP